MNILFCTQSESLHLFDSLKDDLCKKISIGRVGFTVSDSSAYIKWVEQKPDFESQGHAIVKEWEVTNKRYNKPDLKKLSDYEKQLGGEAGLFGAIVADRRLFMGPDCTYSQDYRRRFSDDELLCILQNGLERLEIMFNDLKPDVLISFICVTMLDYLSFLFARSRGIKILNLRPTRVGDRVAYASTLNDPSPEFAECYNNIQSGRNSSYFDEAQTYIKRVREQHGRYEGVIRPSSRPALKANTSRYLKISYILSNIKNYLSYRKSIVFTDNHVPDPLRTLLFTAVINPMRARMASHFLKSRYVTADELKKRRFIFYPLHTEPEVSLLVYGRPYVNQIEIIRLIAMNMPVDTELVIKEHPWMVGKRSIGAYSKMLNIPRVRIAEPSLEARTLIQQCELVVVVTGSIALEAAMLGKPVITFGDCPYNMLPDCMIKRCEDPRHMNTLIRDMLNKYESDEGALNDYVAAVFETSCSINLYSVLLGKKNVYIENSGDYNLEIQKLSTYTSQMIASDQISSSSGSAMW